MTLNKLKITLRENWLGLIILAFTWIIFFSRTIFTKLVYYSDDLKIIYFPLEWAYTQFQQEGALPLWSNLFGFGHPLLAWGQLGFFTPLHLILRALSTHPLTLLQISIVTYFALGSLGMFCFLRRLKVSVPSATLGAIIFTYSGFHVGHLNHVNFYTSTMLLPWLLLWLHGLSVSPSLKKSILVAITASAIALSGQPQIVLYSFIVAALWFAITLFQSSSRIKLTLLLLLSGLLAFGLSSFAILPLAEFLPSTERAYGLSQTELLEFSYPPHQTITLILPYFFGDHYYYWGAKSFQELAAFQGLIPLLLIGASLLYLNQHRSLKIFGLILVALGLILPLGVYSPLYRWLVETGVIKAIAIPGRFVFFLTIGSSVLSASVLDSLINSSFKKKVVSSIIALFFIGTLFYPFYTYINNNPIIYKHFISLISLDHNETTLILAGLLVMMAIFFLPRRIVHTLRLSYLLVITAGITIIAYGWNYNPLTPASVAYNPSPFTPVLAEHNRTNQFPARIYQIEHESVSARSRTEEIASSLSIYQPFISHTNQISCFSIPFKPTDSPSANDDLTISISKGLFDKPLRTTAIATDSLSGTKIEVCFEPLATKIGERLYLSFQSTGDTGIRLTYMPTDNKDLMAYLFRVSKPSPLYVDKSLKPISVIYEVPFDDPTDLESQKLSRHLNVIAGASSPHWIGALAIAPYRSFVSTLLSDDPDPTNYNSKDIIENRRLFIDMTGISHIIENTFSISDYAYLTQAGFNYLTETEHNQRALRLFENPGAFPKAWLGKQAIFSPVADETIYAMRQKDFDPREQIYISGPTPPDQITSTDASPLTGSAVVTRYEPTAIDIDVSTNQLAWLILSDSTTPQWQTYIDGQPAPPYEAFTMFRAAQVPSGQHQVSFRYESPAAKLAAILTSISLLTIIILIVMSLLLSKRRVIRPVSEN